MRNFLRFLLRLLYRFTAHNEAVLKTPGPVLLLPNHVSWWDWLFIGVCLEKDWRFVTSSTTAQLSWFHRFVMVNRLTFPVDINSPYAVKHMAEYLQRGGRLVLFPEGRISTTGSLMKLFEGTGFLIGRTGAKVITAYIRGARRLPFSRNADLKQWFPTVSSHFSEVLDPPFSEGRTGSAARARLTEWLRDRMVLQQFETEMLFGPKTVPDAIVEAARRGAGKVILQDSTMQKLSYRKLLLGADLLSAQWAALLPADEQRIGVLLPNVNGMPVVLLSLWAAGKVPAVLNYSSGAAAMMSCAKVAALRHIITSQAFLTRGRLDVQPLRDAGINIVLMEDVRPRIGGPAKLLGLVRQWFRPRLPVRAAFPHDVADEAQHQPKHQPADLPRHESPAVILFTSGSEGEPKAVELTHRNLLANMRQMYSVIDLLETDRFFNALPLFHSFGLTVGLLLPLSHRVFVFLYPSPLHYRVVPSAFYNLDCTVFFGTNTFLTGYARKAHPYDFHKVRYLFAGAEKVRDSTAMTWMRKFGVRILEGYGATECSPCLSVNLPMHPCHGSAGRFLPGIEYRLEPVEGVTSSTGKAGRLLVRGPNIMRGYLNPEANARFQALGGWYDTGDIVEVDDQGVVFILGRLKRFAKISGEMVSLTAVEEALASSFPEFGPKFSVAVIAKRDETKGEKLVAITNDQRLSLESIREKLRERRLSTLAFPRELKVVHEMPLLGTGKVNYRELEKNHL